MHVTVNQKLTLVLYSLLFLFEIVAGVFLASPTIFSDAFHVLIDILAAIIMIFAYYRISKGDSNKIIDLASFTSGLLLVFFIISVTTHSVSLWVYPETTYYNPRHVILVGGVSLLMNGIVLFLNSYGVHNHDDNHNMFILHVAGDLFNSAAIVVAAYVNLKHYNFFVEPLAVIIFSAIIIPQSVIIMKRNYRAICS